MSMLLRRRGVSSKINVVTDPTLIYHTAEDIAVGAYFPSTPNPTADGSTEFDTRNCGATAFNEISTTHPIYGTRSFHHKNPVGSNASTYNRWDTGVPHDVPEYLSAQYYVASWPTADSLIMSIRTASAGTGSNILSVRYVVSTGKLTLIPAAGTSYALTSTVALNSGFRLELGVVSLGTTNGHGILRYYNTPNGLTPTEVIDRTDLNLGTTAPGQDYFGSYQQVQGYDFWIKNQQKSNQDWPPVRT